MLGFKFELGENAKEGINVTIILSVLLTLIILVTLKYTSKKNDKDFKDLVFGLYYDFVKYIFIEGFLIFFESMEHGHINILSSIARIGAVHSGLLLFYALKKPFGLKAH